MQPDQGPEAYGWLTYAWVIFMGAWGAIAGVIRRSREGKPFNITEIVGEVVICSNLAVVTFWLCEWQQLDRLLTAAIVGICTHFGTRALVLMFRTLEQIISIRTGANPPPPG